MATKKTVHVTHNQQTGALELDEEISIDVGDSVEWDFSQVNIAESHLAFVHFDPAGLTEEQQRFGPFQFLEPTRQAVLALGNDGHSRTYEYSVMILDGDGVLAASAGSHRIVNLATDADTSPDATVTYHPEAPPHERIHVNPLNLSLETGQTAIWYILPENMPTGAFVTFHFDDFPEPMTGPFQSFSMSRGFAGAWLANGVTFSPGARTTVQYHVRLRAADGTVIDGGDPVIDVLGGPPQ
jgi:hypothetical protein